MLSVSLVHHLCTFIFIFLINYSNEFGTKDLFFLVPIAIHRIVNIIILAIPMAFIKSYDVFKFILLELNANYANNIIYGKYALPISLRFWYLSSYSAYLQALYPRLPTDVLCILSALMDTLIPLPFTLFVLEYQKKKAAIRKELEATSLPGDPSAARINVPYSQVLPFVIISVVTNPIIWALILGVIAHFAIDSYPIWFETTTRYIVQSVFPVAMFTMGLFLFLFVFFPSDPFHSHSSL